MFFKIVVIIFTHQSFILRKGRIILVPYILKLQNVIIIMIHLFCEKYFKQ